MTDLTPTEELAVLRAEAVARERLFAVQDRLIADLMEEVEQLKAGAPKSVAEPETTLL